MSLTSGTGQSGLPAHTSTHLPSPDAKGFYLIGGIPIPLRRTFSAIDRLIALPIEALGDLIERKLKHNLETHVETVQKARCKRKKKEKIEDPSPKTTRVIEEWATNAAEVGDDDKDMAALWRALLDEILEEGDDGADLLRIVRSLPPSDVRFFLKNFAEPTASIHQVLRTSFRLDRSYEDVVITRLTNGGLVQRRFSLRLLITFLLLTVAPLFMMYVVVANSPKWDTPPIPWVLILGLAAIATTGVTAFLYSHHVPTKLGAKLCELYKEYRAEPD